MIKISGKGYYNAHLALANFYDIDANESIERIEYQTPIPIFSKITDGTVVFKKFVETKTELKK